MFSHLLKFQLFISILLVTVIPGISQNPTTLQDSLILIPNDSLAIVTDTVAADTIRKSKKKASPIEHPVKYSATDSMIISIQNKRLFLFNEAKVNYQEIDLNADYIEFDMSNNIVMANGTSSDTGGVRGRPVFKQGSEEFTSDTMSYNFKTKKGVIKHIVTEQGEGFLHAERTKRQADGHVHIKNGKYTTCNAAHPHFYIGLTKAIAIPDDKIVSGPAYFVMEDIPTPLVLPFGFFPNTKNRSAGILIPTYGESKQLGFYLTNGGLYIPINEYIDIAIQGDIYTRGTWGLTARSNYYWKYHFRGSFDGSIKYNRVDDIKDYPATNEYSLRWNHSQDPKANPTRTFSANVMVRSTGYSKYYSQSVQDQYESNSSQNSSISYSKRFGNFLSLDMAMNATFENRDTTVNMNLPSANISIMQPIYPFRGKNMSGKPKWFENIQIKYSAQLDNQINTKTYDLFEPVTAKRMKYGFTHTIPISLTNFKILNLINVTPSLSYKGSLYGSHIEKKIVDSVFYGSNLSQRIDIDTVWGLNYAQSLTPGISFSISPKFYGMFQSKKPDSYIFAVRHVITPTASWGFSPDMRDLMPDYRENISYTRSITEAYNEADYSIYEGYLYPVSVSTGSLGAISLGLANNLEMKVRSKKDTANEFKKVPILKNLNFSSSYNPFIDSMRWGRVSMNGSTGLFENKININVSGAFSPYALDKRGQEYNRYYFSETGKLLRLTGLQLTIGASFSSNAGKKKTTDQNNPPEGADYRNENEAFAGYVDFDIPWSFTINYTWTYSKPGFIKTIINSVRLSGDISLTKKWKIGGNTGYDIVKKEFTITNLSFTRDLHCWNMTFSVVPFGDYRSYSFRIFANSAILQDLKWDKRRQWYDY